MTWSTTLCIYLLLIHRPIYLINYLPMYYPPTHLPTYYLPRTNLTIHSHLPTYLPTHLPTYYLFTYPSTYLLNFTIRCNHKV
jgi:hypothetical protein